MFRRKESQFNYVNAIADITKEIRNKNIQLSDPEYIGKGKKAFLTYNLNDLNKLLRATTSSTKQLLNEKGFSLSICDRVEKAVLLNTEISELADAVKKGLGDRAEGLEVADIVIRLTNFLCLNETHHSYEKLSYALSQTVKITDTVVVGVTSDDIYLSSTANKYSLIEDMMICWMNIKKSSEMVEVCLNRGLGSDKFNTAFIVMWNTLIELLAYCSAYTTLYLPENLQFYVDFKMSKNFERPYKYGTSEEIK